MKFFSLTAATLGLAACAVPTSSDDTASSSDALSTASAKVTTYDRATGPSNAQGRCASLPDTDFVVRYENHTIPWGARVVLHSGYGFYEGPPYEWLDVRDDEARAVGPWTFEATRRVDWHGAAAGPLRLDFAVEIILSDGRTIWDTNGEPNGYYLAEWSGACDGALHASPMFHPVR